MLWLKLSVLTCVLFFAIGSVCGNEDFEDVSIEEDEPIVNANKKDNKVFWVLFSSFLGRIQSA